MAASNASWAAFFASQEPNTSICPSIRTMLPLFTEDSKSVAMIMHAVRLIKQSINFLNPSQIPVVALDQPLYAIAKNVQWTWRNEFGEDHFVVVLGGLHIEMAFMSMIGDVRRQWLGRCFNQKWTGQSWSGGVILIIITCKAYTICS